MLTLKPMTGLDIQVKNTHKSLIMTRKHIALELAMLSWSMCDDALLHLVAIVISEFETQEDLFSPWSVQSESSQVSWWSSNMMLTRNVRDWGSIPCWGTELFLNR